MSDRKQVLLRIDPAVHDALARWAADEFRSLNAQIEMLVRRARGRRSDAEASGSDAADAADRPRPENRWRSATTIREPPATTPAVIAVEHLHKGCGVPVAVADVIAAVPAGAPGSHLLPDDGRMTAAETQRALTGALEHAACIRCDGVASLPDPQAIAGEIASSSSASPELPTLQATQRPAAHFFLATPDRRS